MSTRSVLYLPALLVFISPALAEGPAVANLAQDRRPEWLRREGLVMAGSWEQMTFRVRRGRRGDTPPEWEAANDGRDYRPTPQQVEAWRRERSDETIERLKRLGVNFVMIPAYKGAGMVAERNDMEDVVEWAGRCHKAGLHVGVYADSETLLWELFFKEKPEATDWLVRQQNGEPRLYSRSQPFRYIYNRLHPDAHQYYLDVLRFAITEVEADLIHMDNYLRPPGTEACSARLFREYLHKTFSAEELAAMGAANLEAVAPAPTGPPDDMLRRAWLDFSCEFLAESYRRRCEFARSLRSDVLMECNPHGVLDRVYPPKDHFRLVRFGEAFWDEARGPDPSGLKGGELRTRIRSYKVARLLGNMVFCKSGTPLELAEAMAFNLDCLGCICFFEYGIIRRRPYTPEGVPPESMPMIRFYKERRDLFRDGRVVADVAVLRSFPSQAFGDAKTAVLANRVEQELIENRVPFQILGDRNLLVAAPATHENARIGAHGAHMLQRKTLKDLGRHAVLVLPGCPALSDEQIAQIRRYVAEGGRLCLFGPAATHDEWMRPREEPGLGELPADRVVRADGSGDYLEAIRRACGRPFTLEVAGVEQIGLCAELIEQPGRRLVHLVNYRSDQPAENVALEIHLPPGRKATGVRLAGPHHADDLDLPFEQQGDVVHFRVPQVGIYEIAVVRW